MTPQREHDLLGIINAAQKMFHTSDSFMVSNYSCLYIARLNGPLGCDQRNRTQKELGVAVRLFTTKILPKVIKPTTPKHLCGTGAFITDIALYEVFGTINPSPIMLRKLKKKYFKRVLHLRRHYLSFLINHCTCLIKEAERRDAVSKH